MKRNQALCKVLCQRYVFFHIYSLCLELLTIHTSSILLQRNLRQALSNGRNFGSVQWRDIQKRMIDRGLGLHSLLLTDDDLKILGVIMDILEVCTAIVNPIPP